MRATKKAKSTPVSKDLISGFQELADALETGSDLGKKFTCYQLQLDLEPQTYSKERVKEVRNLLNVSQAVFAAFLGASLRSVCDWEQGRNTPQPSVCRFMDEIRHNPEYFRSRLVDSVKPKQRQLAGAKE